jgi:MFS family permease
MMVLNYAIQGAWWPLLAVHLTDLGLSGRERGWIFATSSLAAMAAPLGMGHLADRLLPTQKLLAVIYGLASAILVVLACDVVHDATSLFALFLLYFLITSPGYGLSSSLALRNLPRPAEQFGGVRLWGTVGWMAAGWVVTGVLAFRGPLGLGMGASPAFGVGVALAVGFAVYCVTLLPHTPPLAVGSTRGLDLGLFRELASRPTMTPFLLVALAVSVTAPFIYQTVPAYLQRAGLPRPWIASAMTLSQVPEILALAALPWFHRRLGMRGTMAFGIAAWVLEYLVLALEPPLAIALLVAPLNGLAIAGFVISAQMHLDRQAPPDRRASIQSFYVMLSSGIGSFAGNLLAGELLSRSGGVGPAVFAVPGLINALAVVALWRWFRPGVATPALVVESPPVPRPTPASLAVGRLAPRTGDP